MTIDVTAGAQKASWIGWVGTWCAFVSAMAAKDVRELVCWQLSDALKCEIIAFTATGPAANDFKFRDAIRDSSASVTRNIAEGFGLFTPAQFARFLSYAIGSLDETRDSLKDAHDRAYIDPALYARLSNLAHTARRLLVRLKISKEEQAKRERRKGRRTD